jgi:hypothetical protein
MDLFVGEIIIISTKISKFGPFSPFVYSVKYVHPSSVTWGMQPILCLSMCSHELFQNAVSSWIHQVSRMCSALNGMCEIFMD